MALFSLAGCEDLARLGGSADAPPPDALPHVPIETPEDANASAHEPPGPSKPTVIKAQKLLAARGYDPGPIDGVPGHKTANAIRAFQTDNGMKVDGAISRALIAALEKQPEQPDEPVIAVPAPAAGSREPPVIGFPNPDLPPHYEPGDVFVYSDGHVETVVRVGGNRVVWRADDGSGRTGHPNFMLPSITAHNASGAGRRSSETDAGDLWPMPAGTDRTFHVTFRDQDSGGESVREWHCRGEGGNRITITAGVFDTIVFSCERATAAPGEWKRRVWYYAPTVRHYIRRDEIYEGSERAKSVELFAVQPGGRGWPPAARAGLGWAVEDTLQNKPTGEKTVWRSTVVGTEFLITPTRDPVQRNGRLCRGYVLVREQPENPRHYPAVACRDPQTGRWTVPGVDKGAGGGPIVSGTR